MLLIAFNGCFEVNTICVENIYNMFLSGKVVNMSCTNAILRPRGGGVEVETPRPVSQPGEAGPAHLGVRSMQCFGANFG